jgi:hypothetical protein
LCLLNAFDDVLVELFMADGPFIAFDISILLRLARLDVAQGDALFRIHTPRTAELGRGRGQLLMHAWDEIQAVG